VENLKINVVENFNVNYLQIIIIRINFVPKYFEEQK
jgi:hypothetical protein